MDFNLWQLAMGLFITTTGMACLYTLVSSIVLYSGLKTIKGEDLKSVSVILMYAMIIGFCYAGWHFLNMFGILNVSEFIKDFISNGLLISILFVSMFLSFSIRKLGKEQISKKKAAKRLSKIGRRKSRALSGAFK